MATNALKVIDNTGALKVECINVLKVKTRLKSTGFATVGVSYQFRYLFLYPLTSTHRG